MTFEEAQKESSGSSSSSRPGKPTWTRRSRSGNRARLYRLLLGQARLCAGQDRGARAQGRSRSQGRTCLESGPMADQDTTQLLKTVPLFSDLNDKELERVAESMKRRQFSAGQEIAREGKGVGFFVIEDRNAKVTVHGEEAPARPRRLLRRDCADRPERQDRVRHRRERPDRARDDVLGLPPARRGQLVDRLTPPVLCKDVRPGRDLGQAPPERNEILASPRRIAAELVDLDAVGRIDDAAAEERAARRKLRAEAGDLARRLSIHVVRSTVPSPVTTRSAPSSRSRKPIRSRTRRAPSTSSAPRAASAAPSPPAAPAPGRSRNGSSDLLSSRRRSSSAACSGWRRW